VIRYSVQSEVPVSQCMWYLERSVLPLVLGLVVQLNQGVEIVSVCLSTAKVWVKLFLLLESALKLNFEALN